MSLSEGGVRMVARRVGPAGSPAIAIPFSFGEPGELRALFVDAGFADVRVEPVTIEADFDDPERYVERQIIASAAAIPALQGMTAAERATAIAAVGESLAPIVARHTTNGRVRAPMTGRIVRARKP